jgi:hypothetical protein
LVITLVLDSAIAYKILVWRQMISLGMFAGSKQSTEEDFQMAEFTGDRDNNLDWS